MSDILSLFYVSRAVVPNDRATVGSILRASKKNNVRVDITGCLLYTGQFFAQVLEGRPPDVETLFAKIAADPRHKGSRVVERGASDSRQYDEWSMGFIYAMGLEDDLFELFTTPEPSGQLIENIKRRMRTDSVMGGLA